MKLAMVTTARVGPSAAGAYSHALAHALSQHAHVELFVPHEQAGADLCGLRARSVLELGPREFDQVLHQAGDDPELGFVAPLVRALGGVVVLHDWHLGSLATAAFPELRGRGLRALLRAAREGGLAQARELRAGGSPPLNRSLVRFADAFLTHSQELADAVLAERNAPTPIAVLAPQLPPHVHGAAAASAAVGGAWSELAQVCLAALARFPRPRSARRALVAESLAALRRAQVR